jgi:hypothetical protein
MNEIILREYLNKIESYKKFPFLITDHARLRAKQRKIVIDEVIENIITNKYLVNLEKQSEDKYKLVFQKKGHQKEIYIVRLKLEYVEIITVWKEISKLQKQINRKWKKN